jgi:hypothetical protein
MDRTPSRDEVSFADLETGGLEEYHPTIQVAVVTVNVSDDDWPEVERIERKVRFDYAMCDPKALEVNHWDPKVWEREAVSIPEVRDDLAAYFKRHQTWNLVSKAGNAYTTAKIAGHNVKEFDIPRLRRLFGQRRTPFCWWYPFDTYLVALWQLGLTTSPHGPENYQLATLCRYFGTMIPEGGYHDALEDVLANIQLARHLAGY